MGHRFPAAPAQMPSPYRPPSPVMAGGQNHPGTGLPSWGDTWCPMTGGGAIIALLVAGPLDQASCGRGSWGLLVDLLAAHMGGGVCPRGRGVRGSVTLCWLWSAHGCGQRVRPSRLGDGFEAVRRVSMQKFPAFSGGGGGPSSIATTTQKTKKTSWRPGWHGRT